MDVATLISLIPTIGPWAVLILLAGMAFTKFILPSALKQWEQATSLRIQRENDAQTWYLTELKTLREEAKADKQLLFTAFTANTEANIKLQTTLAEISNRLTDLVEQVHDVRKDVSDVYKILGREKNIITD